MYMNFKLCINMPPIRLNFRKVPSGNEKDPYPSPGAAIDVHASIELLRRQRH
jgi:hypothetical protein